MSNADLQVFTKNLNPATFNFVPQGLLLTSEIIATAVVDSISPVTTPPVASAAPVIASDGLSFSFIASGGVDGMTYGIRFALTTSLGRSLLVTAATHVASDLTTSYATKNPYAFQSLIGKIEAGDAAVGKAFFILPPGEDTSSSYVLWELVSSTGQVYSSGNAFDFLVSQDAFHTTVEANAVVSVPSTVPPSLVTQSYQVRWSLINSANGSAQYAFENLEVLGNQVEPTGSPNLVELFGDVATLQLVVPRPYSTIEVEVFLGNTRVTNLVTISGSKAVSSGWMYQALLDTATLTAALEPYTIMWKCMDAGSPAAQRYPSQLFVVNPSMLNAVEDVQAQVMKARTTLRQESDLMFDPQTILTWLRRGRDYFNGAAGILTEFTMTDATGPIREYWLRYSEVAALQAQALAEGEKSFNFSGQDISLDVDHAAFYDTLADKLLQSVNDPVATFKKNLQIKGVNSGTGNMSGIAAGVASAMGGVGLGLNVLSPRTPWSSGIPYFR